MWPVSVCHQTTDAGTKMRVASTRLLLICSIIWSPGSAYNSESSPPDSTSGASYSTTTSPKTDYCPKAKMRFDSRSLTRASSKTLCLLNNPKTDSCHYWHIVSVVMLNASTPNPDQLAGNITAFLNKVAENCKSDSRVQVFTPDMAGEENLTVPSYAVGSAEAKNVYSSLATTGLMKPGDDPGDMLHLLVKLAIYNDVRMTEVGPLEGAVMFVFLNTDCETMCENQALAQAGADTASILDQGMFVVRYMYLADDDAEFGCLKRLFADCIRWAASLCDIGIYGAGPDVYSLYNASYSEMTCAAASQGMSMAAQVLVIVLPAFFIAVIVIVAMCLRYKKHVHRLRMQIFGDQQTVKSENDNRNKADDQQGNGNFYTDLLKTVSSKKDDWEVNPTELNIYLEALLGSGAFSNVYRGSLSGKVPLLTVYPNLNLVLDSYSMGSTGSLMVAVKKLPAYADDSNRLEVFREIDFMKNLGYHPHVVSLLGCVSSVVDPLIVVEYCAHGDLLKFIRKHKGHLLLDRDDVCPIDVELCLRMKNLISFAWQIADGMMYLGSKNFIHRDLAARNILIANSLVAKISDFGLCRELSTSLYTSRGGRLPIKWMPVESLKYYEFTTSSDVWAYGVLLFELFSLGESPYPAIQPTDMIAHLEAGNRLPQPQHCVNEIYSIMERCWKEVPSERITFNTIRDELTTLLNTDDENYGYISLHNPALSKLSPDALLQRQTSSAGVSETPRSRAATSTQDTLAVFEALFEGSSSRRGSASLDQQGRFLVSKAIPPATVHDEDL